MRLSRRLREVSQGAWLRSGGHDWILSSTFDSETDTEDDVKSLENEGYKTKATKQRLRRLMPAGVKIGERKVGQYGRKAVLDLLLHEICG